MTFEMKILKTLDHPNIIKIYDVLEDLDRVYLITELCKGGELFNSVFSKGKLSETESAIILKQLLSCLNLCHKNKIVHRDIKPENIMLFSLEDELIIKIVDWGTAKILEENQTFESIEGTPLYMAPEVLARNYNEKCDIWSCGVLLYILLSGIVPFEGNTKEKILSNVYKANYNFDNIVWNSISPEAIELIKQMMTRDANIRPSAETLLLNKWLVEKSIVDFKLPLNLINNIKHCK